tara:strand:+ start:2273 stop:2866 length:594 start_codon:yes stop_codon:yes gene_type:complete
MNIDYYFPTPVWWNDTTLDNMPLLSLCNTFKKEDPKGRDLSNRGGWQSKDFDTSEYQEFNEFNSLVNTSSLQCLNDFGYVHGAYKLELSNMWFNINTREDTNQTHIHTGSFISGVYYLQATMNHGEIVFYRNFNEDYIISSAAKIDHHTPISGATCRYPSKTGRLLLFPSWMAHGVMPSNTDEERISLAFNMRIVNV